MRRAGKSEIVGKRDFARHAHLIRGNAAFKEIREFLHILQFHEIERIARSENRRNVKCFKPPVRNVLQVLPHPVDRKPADAETQSVFGKRQFAIHRFAQHLGDAVVEGFIEQVRAL